MQTLTTTTALSEIADEVFFAQLRQDEYHRLDDADHVYLDYTGGGLYAKSQLNQHHAMLQGNVFGNPHSTNPTSQAATRLVEAARQRVLDFFHADGQYECVFTANASASLKIVGECYPFEHQGAFVLLADNHNSVNGIREFCRTHGGQFEYCPINYEDLTMQEDVVHGIFEKYQQHQNKLFAFPAQSNVTGVKHDLGWVQTARDNGWDVLLDAAAFVPTTPLDLREVQPDFVSASFYKIFGYPTGLGCLLIHKRAFPKLRKPWFAGGTVSYASVNGQHHFLHENYERFEDGTVNYLDIPAVKIGLDYIQFIGIERINRRVKALTSALAEAILAVKHSNGKPVARIFGSLDMERHGGSLVMTFFDQNGEKYAYEDIEKMTNTERISIRSGCFCNPGVDEINSCINNDEFGNYFSSHKTDDYERMLRQLKRMRGGTRVSVGIATTSGDLKRFVGFLEELRDHSISDFGV
jgi:molybdenum cofactor sulfurtransferase